MPKRSEYTAISVGKTTKERLIKTYFKLSGHEESTIDYIVRWILDRLEKAISPPVQAKGEKVTPYITMGNKPGPNLQNSKPQANTMGERTSDSRALYITMGGSEGHNPTRDKGNELNEVQSQAGPEFNLITTAEPKPVEEVRRYRNR